MDSEITLNLPVIDFSSTELKPGTSAWETVKSQVRKAALDYGCFQAFLDYIPQEAMSEAMDEFFGLPFEIKQLIVSEKPFTGYFPSSPTLSFPESISLLDTDNFDKVESLTNILWPQEGNISFSKTVCSFSRKLAEFDQMIRRMIVESFGLEKYLDEHMNSTCNYLKFSKYEATKCTEKRTGFGAHTDKTMTSLLFQNQVDGLEVQTKDGEWVNVKFSPNSIIVIIGECLNAWTNGRLYSPYHRVMVSNETRYSAVLFAVPKSDYTIKAVQELVDEEHPLQFKPFEYSEFLKNHSNNFDAPLMAYFGA